TTTCSRSASMVRSGTTTGAAGFPSAAAPRRACAAPGRRATTSSSAAAAASRASCTSWYAALPPRPDCKLSRSDCTARDLRRRAKTEHVSFPWTPRLKHVPLVLIVVSVEAVMVQVSSVKEYFETLPQRFQAEAAKTIQAVFQFELSGDGGGTFHVSVDH